MRTLAALMPGAAAQLQAHEGGAHSIASHKHPGRSQCKLLHKVVEFEIPAERVLTIQLSGDDAATMDFVITAVGQS